MSTDNILSFHRIQLHKCERERDKYKVTCEELEKLVKNSQQTATEFEAQLTDALKIKVCSELSMKYV
jgi:galactokinase